MEVGKRGADYFKCKEDALKTIYSFSLKRASGLRIADVDPGEGATDDGSRKSVRRSFINIWCYN
jgi:hypothetical protein